jgi:hypothetical protein
MAAQTLKQYRVLVDQLETLVHEWKSAQVNKSEQADHIKAMESVINHLKCATCARIKATEQVLANIVISSAETIVRQYKMGSNIEYCFVIDHPKFGQIGGYEEDNWSIEYSAVAKFAAFVRKDWPTRIIGRDATTRIAVDLSQS